MLRLVAEQARAHRTRLLRGPRWRWEARPGPPKRLPTGRTSGDRRRPSDGSTCSRSTVSSARAADRRGIAGEQFARLPPFAVGRAGADPPESVYLASP
jgi:hypothetical protein